MADFAKPILGDPAASVFGTILQGIHTSLAVMFDGTTDTNVPTGAVKFDSAAKTLAKWDGAVWQPKDISNIADGCVTAVKLATDAVDDTKFKLRNSQFLRARNFANSGDLNVLAVDTGNNTVLNTAASALLGLAVGGTSKWVIDGSVAGFDFYPTVDATYGIGKTGKRLSFAYIQQLLKASLVQGTGSDLAINTSTAHNLLLGAGNVNSWYVNNSGGGFSPTADATYNLGATGAAVSQLFANLLKSGAANDLAISTGGAARSLFIQRNGSTTWTMDTNGNIFPVDIVRSMGTAAKPIGTVHCNSVGDSTNFIGGSYATNHYLAPGLYFSADTGSGNPVFNGFPTQGGAGAIVGYLRFQFSPGGTAYKLAYYA